jgi:hypothetical protein
MTDKLAEYDADLPDAVAGRPIVIEILALYARLDDQALGPAERERLNSRIHGLCRDLGAVGQERAVAVTF